MTSKNSFLISMKENWKRRMWVGFAILGIYFMYYPISLALNLNAMKASITYYDTSPMEMMQQMVYRTMAPNIPGAFLVIAVAVIAGLQGFAYLHNRSKVDFYHSQPVSKSYRFAVITVTGILMFLVPFVLCSLLGLLVAIGYGSVTPLTATSYVESILVYLLLYISMYFLSMLAAILTGHGIVSILGIGVLSVLEIGIRALLYELSQQFHHTFYGRFQENNIFHCILSPITVYAELLTKRYRMYLTDIGVRAGLGKYVLNLIVLSVIFLALAWFAYRKRPAESTGKGLAFSTLKSPVKLILSTLVGIFGGFFFYMISGKSMVLMIVGVLLVTVIAHILIEVIYEFDLKAIKNHWLTTCIAVLLSVVVLLAYRFDWMGFDRNLPKQDKVETVSIYMDLEPSRNTTYYLPENGQENSLESYAIHNMKLTDLDPVYAFLEQTEVPQDKDGSWLDQDTVEPRVMVYVKWNLKNGKTVYRTRVIDLNQHMDVIEPVYAMPEYQSTVNQMTWQEFAKVMHLKRVEMDYRGIDFPIDGEAAVQVWEAYRKDVLQTPLGNMNHSIPLGTINFYGTGIRNAHWENNWNAYVYPAYTNTIKVLEKLGVPLTAPMDVQEVEMVSIYSTKSNISDYGQYSISYGDSLIYSDPRVVKTILEHAVPAEDVQTWLAVGLCEPGIVIDIQNTYKGYRTYYFEKGKVPEFVLQDLAKASLSE